MRQLQHLYAVESRLRKINAGPKLRQAVRSAESPPIVQRLERVLLRLKSGGKNLPQSPLGTAIDYTLGQWATLQMFLTDGRIEIDNNLVENAIRPTAVGKNYAEVQIMQSSVARLTLGPRRTRPSTRERASASSA